MESRANLDEYKYIRIITFNYNDINQLTGNKTDLKHQITMQLKSAFCHSHPIPGK